MAIMLSCLTCFMQFTSVLLRTKRLKLDPNLGKFLFSLLDISMLDLTSTTNNPRKIQMREREREEERNKCYLK